MEGKTSTPVVIESSTSDSAETSEATTKLLNSLPLFNPDKYIDLQVGGIEDDW